MTNEEIIEQLENTIALIKQDGKDWLDDRDIPILETCIKSITALDKIRAEIEEYRDGMPWESKSLVKWEAINYILEQILDKYKAETENRE